MLNRSLIAASWGVFALACSSPTGPKEVLTVVTDSATYHLVGPSLQVRVGTQVTNRLDHTIYLHRSCGALDNPSVLLGSLDEGEGRAALHIKDSICDGTTDARLRPPIAISSGETQEYAIVIYRSTGEPPAPMEASTGRFRLSFEVQPTAEVESWRPADPYPLELTRSNDFVIQPPVDGG